MPDPIMASELPKVKLNLKGIRDYARKKGVSIASLSDADKFVSKNIAYELIFLCMQR